MKKKYLSVQEFIDLVNSKSPKLTETFVQCHKVEPGRVYERCVCTADSVDNIQVTLTNDYKMEWSDADGDPTISFDSYQRLMKKLTYDGEWLYSVYQNIPK